MNTKQENSKDFCPNYVQEFGLSTLHRTAPFLSCVFPPLTINRLQSPKKDLKGDKIPEVFIMDIYTRTLFSFRHSKLCSICVTNYKNDIFS